MKAPGTNIVKQQVQFYYQLNEKLGRGRLLIPADLLKPAFISTWRALFRQQRPNSLTGMAKVS